VTDAARIDLKALSDKFYQDVCGATLQPVLDTILLARDMGAGVGTHPLIIPTLNDRERDLQQLCGGWWSISAATCRCIFAVPPAAPDDAFAATPLATLNLARDLARAAGLSFVYLGNILEPDAATTWCPACRKPLVRRSGFSLLENRLQHGACPDCGRKVWRMD